MNGKPARRYDLGGIMAASPAVVGEDVVVHAMNGPDHALDRHNGRILAATLPHRSADRSPRRWS